MYKNLAVVLASLLIAGCAANTVAVSSAGLSDGQSVTRQQNMDIILSRKKLDVELTAMPFMRGQPIITRLRITNPGTDPISFDPQRDVRVTIDGVAATVYSPEEASRPFEARDGSRLAGGLAFVTLHSLATKGRGSDGALLLLAGTHEMKDYVDEKNFREKLLQPQNIMAGQTVEGVVLISSTTPQMYSDARPAAISMSNDKVLHENSSGRIDITIQLAGEQHLFALAKGEYVAPGRPASN